MAKYQYKYLGEDERFFPTLGKQAKKDDIIESDEALYSPLLEEIKPADPKEAPTK